MQIQEGHPAAACAVMKTFYTAVVIIANCEDNSKASIVDLLSCVHLELMVERQPGGSHDICEPLHYC
jgi:hypothetical protein